MATAGTAYVDVRARFDQFNRDLSTISGKISGVSSKMRSIGRGMTLGLTVPLVAFATKATQEFAEVEQANAQTAAALKSTSGAANVTGKHIRELSAHIGKLSAQDAELVQASTNVLLTFTKVRNEVGKGNKIFDRTALAAANLSARFGTDLSSAMLQVGKAMNDPLKGISALSRSGVQFTEQQKEQIKTMVESGRTLDAQKLILRELDSQVGGSAQAAGKAASPMTKLSLAFNDLAEKIGKSLMPFLKDLTKIITGLADRFSNLSPGVRKMVVVFGLVAAAAGPVIWALGAIGTALAFLAAHPIVLAIAAVVGLAIVIKKNWSKIAEVTSRVWNGIKDTITGIWEGIKSAASAAARFVINTIDTMLGPIDEIIGKLASIGGGVVDFLNPFDGGKAAGGPVAPRRTYLVGEKGPELLRLGNMGGTVIPNHQISASASINPRVLAAAVAEGVRLAMRSEGPEIVNFRMHESTLTTHVSRGAKRREILLGGQ